MGYGFGRMAEEKEKKLLPPSRLFPDSANATRYVRTNLTRHNLSYFPQNPS